ncbi:MAG: hypothetical protein KDC85_23480 [Saprospiraceae bacterium]|nr:hypothetical protein [Saprospiraceae bacterium]MCB9326337.1 hypothetical protein [Lewinellaceae bacterium]
MKKVIRIIVFLFLGIPFTVLGQTGIDEDCYELLQKARHDLEIGKIERVEERVKGCLRRKDLSSDLRVQILELLIETSLFLEEDEKAEKYYKDLKFIDPFATLDYNIPETKYLQEKFETYPSTTYSFFAGGSPNLKGIAMDGTPEGVGLLDLNLKRERGDLFGWFAGVEAAFNINNSRWDASIGYTFHKNYLHYSADLENALFDAGTGERGPATLSFTEQVHWSQVALGLVYQFKKRDRFEKIISPCVFIKLGGMYAHNNASKITSPVIDFPIQDVLKTRDAFETGPLRNDFLLSAKVGGAVRVRLYRHFFAQGGVVYHRVLTNMAKGDSANATYNNLVTNFNFQDDEFTAHQLGFFAGFGYYLFKTKKIK